MATRTDTRHALPARLGRGLGAIERRLRAVAALRGLGTVALVLAGGAVAGMAADVALVLPTGVRWAFWGLWLAAGGGLGVAWVIRPLRRRVEALDLAALAEGVDPTFGERLTGAVGLAERGALAHGSPVLIAALVDQADEQAARIDPRRAVPSRRAVRRLGLGAGLLALVFLPAPAVPNPLGDLARRFLLPWADIERVGRYVVTVRDGDRIVALGDDVEIVADVRSRFGSVGDSPAARLVWTDASGRAREAPMVAEAGGGRLPDARVWRVTRPRVAGSFTYRVAFGSARSAEHAIRAVEPPAVAALSVNVEPPGYLRRAAYAVADASLVEAWEGSAVSLLLRSTAPLASASLEWPVDEAAVSDSTPPTEPVPGEDRGPDSPPPKGARGAVGDVARVPLEPVGAGGTAWSVTVPAWVSGTYAVVLVDRHGLPGRPGPARRVVVLPDRPPTVAFTTPEDVLAASRPDDVLPVGIAARDDVSVMSVELRYAIRRLGATTDQTTETGRVAATLPGLGKASARGDARLELAPLNLRPGDAVSYRARVADSRPAPRGPNVSWTPERTLAIVAEAEPNAVRRAAAERDALREELEAIRRSAESNRRAAERLRYAADAVARRNGTWDDARRSELDASERAARDVVDRLQLLARALAGRPPFAPLAPPARQVAEEQAEPGRRELAQARRAGEDAARLDALKAADARLGATVQGLDALRRRFDELAQRDAENPGQPGDAEPGEESEAPEDGSPGGDGGDPAEPGDDALSPDPQGRPAGEADADLAALQALVKEQTGRAWGELPSHLRSEILQLSRGAYRPDYARLIRLYFREIAAGAEEQP